MVKIMKNPFTDENIAHNYDTFYDNEVGRIYDKLEKKAIYELTSDIQGGNLIEFGCGTGHWSEYFAHLKFRITGVEISEPMLKIAKKKNIPNSTFIQGDAESIKLNTKFDVAAFITSLEFINDVDKAIENAIKHLKKGSHIILGVLNLNSVLGERRESNGIYANAHFYTHSELLKIFKKYGKVVLKSSAFASPEEIGKAEQIEKESLDKGLTTGNFIAGRVDLPND